MMTDAQNPHNILSYGAKGDGLALDTAAIQSAIEAAHQEAQAGGSGVVLFPPGAFLSGSLHLKSGVNLHLEAGAVLLGSPHRMDYERGEDYALLLADGQQDIALTGSGIIDGQGRQLAADVERLVAEKVIEDPYRSNRPSESNRPMLISFHACRGVRVEEVTLRDAACWVQTYHQCQDLRIEGIRVESTAYWNNDGIDLVDCQDVTVTRCVVNSADDAICLKSSDPQKSCENIHVQSCILRSSASALKFGTASAGGFRHVRVENLEIYDTYRSAIALEIVDGGLLEDVDIHGVRATNTGNAIFLRLGQRDQDRPPGTLRRVHIRDVNVQVPKGKPDVGYETAGPPVSEPHNLIPSSITGLPGAVLEEVTLEDIEISFAGGGSPEAAEITLDDLEKVPERSERYPEFSMFGELPAWGFYVRHASGLHIHNLRLHLAAADYRPALVFDDVQRLVLEGIEIDGQTGSQTQVALKDVQDAVLSGISGARKLGKCAGIELVELPGQPDV